MTDVEGFTSPEARRKAIYRAKVKMPFHPSKFATVVEGLIKSASPSKRKAINEKIQVFTPNKKKRLTFLEETVKNFKETYTNLKISRSKADENKRRVLGNQLARLKKLRMMKAASRELGIRYKSLLKWSQLEVSMCESRIKRSDALEEDVVKDVKDFFISPEISLIHAGKKTVLKKLMLQKQTLNETLEETYKKFREKNPASKVSFSKFVSLKPKHVEPSTKRRFRGCLCEKCTNIELQLKSINNWIGQNSKIVNKYMSSKITLCQSQEKSHSPDCIYRKCRNCGTKKMLEYLNLNKETRRPQVEDATSPTTSWYQWETTEFSQNGKTSKRKMLVQHSGTLDELILTFCKSLEQFSIHLFEATWQYERFVDAKKDIQEGEVVCVMDFAENLALKNQDECQSAHWFTTQVTIHPIVTYYLVPEKESTEKKKMVTHEMVFISDDLTHDSQIVEQFVRRMTATLQKEIVDQKITKIIQFTDGCSSQYKSKRPFLDISEAKISTERHFFGSGHGKGPADGCSGVVKASATRALLGGVVLNSAKDVFNFLSKKMTKADEDGNFRRSFYFCSSSDVRAHCTKTPQLQTIKGTRKLHVVKGVGSGIIECRKLSCFCNYCKYDIGECSNKKFVEPWEVKKLTKNTQKPNSTLPPDDQMETAGNQQETGDEEMDTGDDGMDTGDDRLEPENDHKKPEDDQMETEHGTWETIRLSRSKTYENLQERIKNMDLNPILRKEELAINVDTKGRNIDELSVSLMPDLKNMTNTDLHPVSVMADGNCLPRTASLLAFGTEGRHQEMRKRIAVDMVINEEKYIKLEHLESGRCRDRLIKSCTMYSEYYIPGTKITAEIVQKIYRKEVMEILKLSTYMGIWEICALATVMNTPIASVYPNKGSKTVRLDLHRVIPPLPKENLKDTPVNDTMFLMWTTTRSDMVERNWIPNHFVPLLPAESSQNISIIFSDDDSMNDMT